MAFPGQRIHLCMILTDTAQMPSLKVVLIDIPTRNAENAYFPTSPKRYVINLLNFCRSDSKN